MESKKRESTAEDTRDLMFDTNNKEGSISHDKDLPQNHSADNTSKSSHLNNIKEPGKSMTRIVVTKRKRNNTGNKVIRRGGGIVIRKHVLKPAPKINNTKTSGLPSFQHRHATSIAGSSNPQQKNETNDDDQSDSSSISSLPEDVASETLVAIHSIIQAQQGLSIPLAENHSIQAVLENQIYTVYHENNATSIHSEILELVHKTNHIRQLYCQDKATTAYVLTKDFVQAVWDAANRDLQQDCHLRDEIVTWYVSNLKHWTGKSVSTSEMQARWEQQEEAKKSAYNANKPFDNKEMIIIRPFGQALKHLMDLQLLIRDNSQPSTVNSHQDANYYMWLPQWALVLKAWNDAKRQLINLLARSKEVSKMNLLRQNRHSLISTHFLLKELVYEGVVTIIERPFGSFVQLVKGNSQVGT
jgi:hypothetical protein